MATSWRQLICEPCRMVAGRLEEHLNVLRSTDAKVLSNHHDGVINEIMSGC